MTLNNHFVIHELRGIEATPNKEKKGHNTVSYFTVKMLNATTDSSFLTIQRFLGKATSMLTHTYTTSAADEMLKR